jgi:hypothetical protein
LREDLILRWTYHSNAIEGNTLALNEIKNDQPGNLTLMTKLVAIMLSMSLSS